MVIVFLTSVFLHIEFSDNENVKTFTGSLIIDSLLILITAVLFPYLLNKDKNKKQKSIMIKTVKSMHEDLFSAMFNEYLLSIIDFNDYKANYINTRIYIENNMNENFFKQKIRRNCEEIIKETPNFRILTSENTLSSRGCRLDKFKENYIPTLEKYIANVNPIMTDDYREKVTYLLLLFNTIEFGLKYNSFFDMKSEVIIKEENIEAIKKSHLEFIDTLKILLNYFE